MVRPGFLQLKLAMMGEKQQIRFSVGDRIARSTHPAMECHCPS
jgi:hypothetical protein